MNKLNNPNQTWVIQKETRVGQARTHEMKMRTTYPETTNENHHRAKENGEREEKQ